MSDVKVQQLYLQHYRTKIYYKRFMKKEKNATPKTVGTQKGEPNE